LARDFITSPTTGFLAAAGAAAVAAGAVVGTGAAGAVGADAGAQAASSMLIRRIAETILKSFFISYSPCW